MRKWKKIDLTEHFKETREGYKKLDPSLNIQQPDPPPEKTSDIVLGGISQISIEGEDGTPILDIDFNNFATEDDLIDFLDEKGLDFRGTSYCISNYRLFKNKKIKSRTLEDLYTKKIAWYGQLESSIGVRLPILIESLIHEKNDKIKSDTIDAINSSIQFLRDWIDISLEVEEEIFPYVTGMVDTSTLDKYMSGDWLSITDKYQEGLLKVYKESTSQETKEMISKEYNFVFNSDIERDLNEKN